MEINVEQVPASLGRRPKFTPTTIDKLCALVQAGNYIKTACLATGIAENTFYHWRRIAENAKHPNRLQRYFLQSLTRAEAMSEARHVQRLFDAANADWRASAHYLERKYPEKWGRRDFVGALGKDGKPTDLPDLTINRVLVVPAAITDIHEWSRQAKVIDAEVRDAEKLLLEHDADGPDAKLPK